MILTIIRRLGVHGGVGYRLRVRRHHARRDDDRRADDDLQHVDRGRRARRLRQPRRDDVRVPARPAVRAVGRGVRSRGRLVAADRVRSGRRVRRPRGASTRRRSSRPSPGASTRASRSASASRLPPTPTKKRSRSWGSSAGRRVEGTRIDVAFIGSCTNGRLSDLEEAARVVRGPRVAPHVKALVVPGSQAVSRAAEARGLHEIFTKAGFEWRGAGCSMCLAMNPDKLEGRQVCASSSNRNFKGRQGSPTGRTLLMSPAMVAAAAVAGEVVDVREMLEEVRRDQCRWHRSLTITGRGLPAPRRRPRHRSHHAGALPARGHVRRARAAPVRGRSRGRIRRIRSTIRATPARRSWSSTQLRLRVVARARAAGAGALRHPGHRRRVVLGDLPGQLGDARAFPASSADHAVDRRAAVADRARAGDRDRRATSRPGVVTAGELCDSGRVCRRRCATRSSAASGIRPRCCSTSSTRSARSRPAALRLRLLSAGSAPGPVWAWIGRFDGNRASEPEARQSTCRISPTPDCRILTSRSADRRRGASSASAVQARSRMSRRS